MHLLALLLLGAAPAADAAAPSSVQPAAEGRDADARLLHALLVLHSGAPGPERAPGAAELGTLGDPRAVGPLSQAVTDPSRAVRRAALQSLAAYPTPEARQTLLRMARECEEPPECKLAVESLAQQQDGGRALLLVAGDDAATDDVRGLALTRARERFPELVAAAPPPPDHSGRAIAVISGAAFGSYTLAAIGNLGANRDGPTIGGWGGALVGGGAALLLTQSVPLSRGQAATIATAGGWGLATGLVAGALTDRNPSSTTVTSLGLLGELAGLVPALALHDRIPLTGGDAFFANLAGLTGASIAAGSLLYLHPRDDARPAMALTMGAGLAGLGLGATLGRRLHFTSDGQFAVPVGALLGGVLANDLTLALNPADSTPSNTRDRRQGGAWLLGPGLGAIAGGTLAQLRPGMTAQDELGIAAGALLTRFAGGGAVRLLTGSETSADGASAAALVLGGVVADRLLPRTRFDGTKLLLGSVGASWGLWQGLGFAGYHDEKHPGSTLSSDEWGAVTRLGFGLGGLAGATLLPAAQVSAGQGVAAFTTGAWAFWLTHWIGYAGDASNSSLLLADLLVSDAGLVAGGFAVSPLVGVPPAAIGVVSLYGAAGSALFSLAAALFTGDRGTGHPIATANIAGTLAGLGIGVLGAATWHRDLYAAAESPSAPVRIAGIPLPEIAPLVVRGGTGLSLLWR